MVSGVIQITSQFYQFSVPFLLSDHVLNYYNNPRSHRSIINLVSWNDVSPLRCMIDALVDHSTGVRNHGSIMGLSDCIPWSISPNNFLLHTGTSLTIYNHCTP